MRRLVALLALAGGALYFKRRKDARRERVHLYYDDGSMVTVERSRPEAERLLTLARQAL